MMRTSLPNFSYEQPKTIEEALKLVVQHQDTFCFMAGGTDLLVDMRAGLKAPKVVIDLKSISELQELSYKEGIGLRIGATVTATRLLKEPRLPTHYRCLYDSISDFCDAILRSRATIGGNICTASPAADSVPPLLVLGAKLEIVGPKGKRELPLKEFFQGVKQSSLAADEILTTILLPNFPEGCPNKYMKMKRGAEDLAVVGTAGLHHPDGKVLLAYSSVAPTPVLIDITDQISKGNNLTEKIELAVEIALKNISPITDVRGGEEYRKNMVDITTRFVLSEILGGTH
ncbi:MAG: FAD binding domain-containing protein [Candidatus Hodarchaeota archaeon]